MTQVPNSYTLAYVAGIEREPCDLSLAALGAKA